MEPLLTDAYLDRYRQRQRLTLEKHLARLARKLNGGHVERLRLYESAVYSSQVEGSKVTMDEFVATMEVTKGTPRLRSIREVHDLVLAYEFAGSRTLNTKNLLEAHTIASATVIGNANDRGAWRSKGVKVGNALVTIYMAPHQSLVPGLMTSLMAEVRALMGRKLDLTETFYYAALLHLAFVKVHPFIDGNGRTGRLLEKWFLAHHLGPVAWRIRSEQYTIEHRGLYYKELARLGTHWGALDWEQCIPFLLMLPKALRYK